MSNLEDLNLTYLTTSLVAFLPSNDTHVQWMYDIAKHLPNWIFIILPGYGENAEMALRDLEIDYIEYKMGLFEKLGVDILVLGNDWGSFENVIIDEAHHYGIHTICIQEGLLFFSIPGLLQKAENVFLLGPIMAQFVDRKDSIFITGNPKFDNLIPLSLPETPVVMINSNFCYGLWENLRLAWIEDVVNACKMLGVKFFISKHPRDNGVFPDEYPVFPSSSKKLKEQMARASIVISRSSTIIYEAILTGREVVYYNPHHENSPILEKQTHRAVWNANDLASLVEAIKISLENVGKPRPEIDRFIVDNFNTLDHDSYRSCIQSMEEILQKKTHKKARNGKLKLKSFYEKTAKSSEVLLRSILKSADDAFVAQDYTAARLHLEQAIKAEPFLVDLYVLYSNILVQLNDFEGAYRSLLKAVIYAPDHVQALTNLSLVACRVGEKKKAIAFINRTIAIQPDNPELVDIKENILAFENFSPSYPASDEKNWVSPEFNEEIDFWDKELSLHGQFFEDIVNRSDPNRSGKVFPTELFPFIQKIHHEKGHKPIVLDAGSGPLSMLAYAEQQGLIDLVAADPLAGVYLKQLKKYGYAANSYLINSPCEKINNFFTNETFDIVWMRNAIDHAADPHEVFQKLVSVMQPGGYLLISGYTFESSFERKMNNQIGLHKHDIFIETGGELMCKSMEMDGSYGPTICLNEDQPLELVSSTPPSKELRGWMEIVWKKTENK
jgi:SAM-dependent methyltransferase